MEAVVTTNAKQTEPKSVTQLIHEFIRLDPPASIEQLIHLLDRLWVETSAAKLLVDAIAKRPELKARHLVQIIKKRDMGGELEIVCDLLLDHNPSIEDLRFAFARAAVSRARIAPLLCDHPEATYSDLQSAAMCDNLDPSCRERLQQRIEVIRQSPASALIQRIEQRYSETNYRID